MSSTVGLKTKQPFGQETTTKGLFRFLAGPDTAGTTCPAFWHIGVYAK